MMWAPETSGSQPFKFIAPVGQTQWSSKHSPVQLLYNASMVYIRIQIQIFALENSSLIFDWTTKKTSTNHDMSIRMILYFIFPNDLLTAYTH